MSTRSWPAKFRDAARGIALAVRGERSFAVHLPMAAAVIFAAVMLRVSLIEWGLLGLCMTVVLAAEMLNTALERLASRISDQPDPAIGAALDIASGAVLITAIGSAAVGGAIFLNRLGLLLNWWPAA